MTKSKQVSSKRERKGKALSIWIDSTLKAKLRRIAKQEKRSVSSVARNAVELYADKPPEALPKPAAEQAAAGAPAEASA